MSKKKLQDREPFNTRTEIKFGDIFVDNLEKLDEEVLQIQKGNILTTVICRFDKEGYLVSWLHSSKHYPLITNKTDKIKGKFIKRKDKPT